MTLFKLENVSMEFSVLCDCCKCHKMSLIGFEPIMNLLLPISSDTPQYMMCTPVASYRYRLVRVRDGLEPPTTPLT